MKPWEFRAGCLPVAFVLALIVTVVVETTLLVAR